MTLKEKIEILKFKYPLPTQDHRMPSHVALILVTYEEYKALTTEMHKTLDKIVERSEK